MSESYRLSDVADVLRSAGLLARPGDFADVEIAGVSQDSRTVQPGELFLAWAGTAFDAHAFVAGAVARGAVAALVEHRVEGVEIPQLEVTRGRTAAGLVAQNLAGSPCERMFVVGITGTNGKTSTALMIRHLLSPRSRAAVIGTLGVVGSDGAVVPGTESLTTPGPVQLAEWLKGLQGDGAEAVAIEASSHALEQDRLAGVAFDVGVFTNLTQDHLDYHETLDRYRDAKARLLDLLKPGGLAVVNGDDPAWAELPLEGCRRVVFGRSPAADVRGEDETSDATGSRFTLVTPQGDAQVRLPLVGDFNVENALAAAAVALEAGLTLDQVAAGLSDIPQIPGRLEVVSSDPATLIDFAHTPAALERVLDALRPLVDGRLIVVFGAGGDRDRTKRPLMGRAVAARADLPVVSSDNPRNEDPEAIIDEVVPGLGDGPYLRIADRRDAIRAALAEARPGDLVLLAGKGHETYQVLGNEKVPFDERAVVAEWQNERGAA